MKGLEINDDGSKLFLVFSDAQSSTTGFGARLLEYTLQPPFDLTTISLVTKMLELLLTIRQQWCSNPSGMSFSKMEKDYLLQVTPNQGCKNNSNFT